MVKYKSTLHQLCDGGHRKKGNWDKVVNYLNNLDSSGNNTPVTLSGPQNDETPLRIASLRAPPRIISALLTFHPQSAKIPDRHRRLPLHYAARRPTGGVSRQSRPQKSSQFADGSPGVESEAVLKLLIAAFPGALVWRDEDGRTPLHYLFLHHASSRALRTVEMMLAVVGFEKGGMGSASGVADEKGCIPLHYAVSGGASKEAIKRLVTSDPLSVERGDKSNKTALHWYITSGLPCCPDEDDLQGEVTEETVVPQPARSSNIVSLLLNEKVAAVRDDTGRTILHWACHALALSLLLKDTHHLTDLYYSQPLSIGHLINSGLGIHGGDKEGCLSIRALKLIIEARHLSLIEVDDKGKTPLHVFFSTVCDFNQWVYAVHLKRVKRDIRGEMLDVGMEGVKGGVVAKAAEDGVGKLLSEDLLKILQRYDPPIEIVKLLSQSPSYVKPSNRFPHRRREIQIVTHQCHSHDYDYQLSASDSESSTSTSHSSPPSNAIQHPEDVIPHEETTNESSHPSHQEDSKGRLPLHYAAMASVSPSILSLLISHHPPALITTEDDYGRTPLHLALGSASTAPLLSRDQIEALLDGILTEVLDGRVALKMPDVTHRFPLHSAAECGCSLDVLRAICEESTESVAEVTEEGDLPVHLLFEGDIFFLRLKHKEVGDFQPFMADQKGGIMMTTYPNSGCLLPPATSLSPHGDHPKLRAIEDSSSNNSNNKSVSFQKVVRQEHSLKVSLLLSPLISHHPSALLRPSSKHAILPIHLAAAYSCYDLISALLNLHPSTASLTTALPYKHTPLSLLSLSSPPDSPIDCQLYDDCRVALFAHHPNDEPWRRDAELLTRSVVRIRREIEDDRELSEVGRRLWIFFATFQNDDVPEDHYAHAVAAILDDLELDTAVRLVNWQVEGKNCLKNVAHVKCRLAMQSYFCFLGRYGLPTKTISEDMPRLMSPRPFYHRGRRNVLVEAVEYQNDEGSKRPVPVVIKFIKHKKDYENEVTHREIAADSFQAINNHHSTEEQKGDCNDNRSFDGMVPIVAHYKAIGDRRYEKDTKDDKYSLDIEDEVVLADFPYAVVMPLAERDLMDVLSHETMSLEEAKEVGRQIGMTIKELHEKNVIHGNLQLRNILRFKNHDNHHFSSKSASIKYTYFLSDLSQSHRIPVFDYDTKRSAVGELGSFATGYLPPEMIASVSLDDIKKYEKYWSQWELSSDDHDLITPKYAKHGGIYVVKSFYNENDDENNENLLSPFFLNDTNTNGNAESSTAAASLSDPTSFLPYSLSEASEAIDIWSFALILYTLCHPHHAPLLPLNPHTNHLLSPESYHALSTWDKTQAEAAIFSNISDPLAQDILLHMLVPLDERCDLTMEMILCHPFFQSKTQNKQMQQATQMIMEQRLHQAQDYMEKQEAEIKSSHIKHTTDLRTTVVSNVSLATSAKMLHSASLLNRLQLNASPAAIHLPPFIILPYKLARNKHGKLTPSTKKDVEMAERVGKHLLSLCKATRFVAAVDSFLCNDLDALDSLRSWMKQQKQQQSQAIDTDTAKLELSFLKLISLNQNNFSELSMAMVALSRLNPDQFMSNPLRVALTLIEEAIKAILQMFCFTEYHHCKKERGYLYLVDEYDGTPVLHHDDDTYPKECNTRKEHKLMLGMTYMVVNYVMATSGSLEGLVKLIFEGAYPHVPQSWEEMGKGLQYKLERETLIREGQLVRMALDSLDGGTEETTQHCVGITPEDMMREEFIHTNNMTNKNKGDEELRDWWLLFEEFDKTMSLGGLKRVVCGKGEFWTEYVEACRSEGDVKMVADEFQQWKEDKRSLKEKDARIARLERLLKDRTDAI